MPSSREKVRPSVADEEAKPYPSPASPAQPVAVPQSQQQAAQVAQQAAAQAQQQQARQAAAKQGSGPLLPPPITPPPLPGVSRPAAAKATEEPRLTKPAETVSGAGARGGGMPLPLQPQQHGLGALAVAPGARGAFGRPPDGKLEGLGGAAGQGLNAALRGPVAAPGWATEAPPFVALHQLDAARGRGGALTRPDAAAAAAVAALPSEQKNQFLSRLQRMQQGGLLGSAQLQPGSLTGLQQAQAQHQAAQHQLLGGHGQGGLQGLTQRMMLGGEGPGSASGFTDAATAAAMMAAERGGGTPAGGPGGSGGGASSLGSELHSAVRLGGPPHRGLTSEDDAKNADAFDNAAATSLEASQVSSAEHGLYLGAGGSEMGGEGDYSHGGMGDMRLGGGGSSRLGAPTLAAVDGPLLCDPAANLRLLEASFRCTPQPSDSAVPRRNRARGLAPLPASFPTTPPAIMENPALFEQLDSDALFFSFYFQQARPGACVRCRVGA